MRVPNQLAKQKKFWIYLILFTILVVISSQQNVLEYLEGDLSAHMIVEHGVFFTVGILFLLLVENLLKILVRTESRPPNDWSLVDCKLSIRSSVIVYWKRITRAIFRLNNNGFCWILMATSLIIFWHIPIIFDTAEKNNEIHILQHISFIIVGTTVYLCLRSLGENSVIFLIFSMAGMMALNGLVFVVLTEKIYLPYSLLSHIEAGNYMIITSIIILLVVFPTYIIKRSMHGLKV
jgi:hypothetical protein